jgi:hypothetical protein
MDKKMARTKLTARNPQNSPAPIIINDAENQEQAETQDEQAESEQEQPKKRKKAEKTKRKKTKKQRLSKTKTPKKDKKTTKKKLKLGELKVRAKRTPFVPKVCHKSRLFIYNFL